MTDLLPFQCYRRSFCRGLQPIPLSPCRRTRGYGYYHRLWGIGLILCTYHVPWIAYC